MKVTAEMVSAALEVVRGYTNVPAFYVQDALEAALAGVPEPGAEPIDAYAGNMLELQHRIRGLESQLAFERERYELLAMDYAGADADRKAQPPAPDPSDRVRIAELESAVQHADELVAVLTYVEQRLCIEGDYCTDRHCVVEAVERIPAAVTSVAKERDAALDRLQKAREWLSDGHADLITLGGILRHD